jgi:hypothetical protein
MNNIPDDILVNSILPYLQPEEIFALKATDKHLGKSIRRLRPYFVSRAEQLPKKMLIKSSRGEHPLNEARRFRFLVQTPSTTLGRLNSWSKDAARGVVPVMMEIRNCVWYSVEGEENDMDHPTFLRRIDMPFFEFDGTAYTDDDEISPQKPEHWLNGEDSWDPFDSDDWDPDWEQHSWVMDEFNFSKKERKVIMMKQHAAKKKWDIKQKKVKVATKCIELCAMQLQLLSTRTSNSSAGELLPSAEYIVHQLPQYFHKQEYFSEELLPVTNPPDRNLTSLLERDSDSDY